jgi:hypothetical protein
MKNQLLICLFYSSALRSRHACMMAKQVLVTTICNNLSCCLSFCLVGSNYSLNKFMVD